MTRQRKDRFSASALYGLALRLHSAIPRRLFRGGYAFPAWHYYLEMTRACNLRCRMCQYIKWLEATPASKQREGELTETEWRRVIDETWRFSLLTFTGGEPFVRKDFPAIFEYASARRVTHCISNCVLLDEERARWLVDLAPKRFALHGFVFLGCSLDAPGALHDEIRGAKGAFEKATSGIRALTAHRDAQGKRWPKVHVTSVIQAANLDVLPEMPRVVRDIGADILNLTNEIRFHDVDGVGEVDAGEVAAGDIPYPRIDGARLRRALEATQEAARREGIALRLPRMPVGQIVAYYTDAMDLAQFGCVTPWTTLIVGRTGDVFPCFIKKVGNVREAPLAALWNGPEMRRFRQRCREGLWPICMGCCEMEYRGPDTT